MFYYKCFLEILVTIWFMIYVKIYSFGPKVDPQLYNNILGTFSNWLKSCLRFSWLRNLLTFGKENSDTSCVNL